MGWPDTNWPFGQVSLPGILTSLISNSTGNFKSYWCGLMYYFYNKAITVITTIVQCHDKWVLAQKLYSITFCITVTGQLIVPMTSWMLKIVEQSFLQHLPLFLAINGMMTVVVAKPTISANVRPVDMFNRFILYSYLRHGVQLFL